MKDRVKATGVTIQLPEFSHSPIDIHSHFNHGSPCDTPETYAHIRALEHVIAGYNRFGIYYAGMSTFASVVYHPECVVEENEYLHDLVKKTDWMYQWVVIDPRQERTYEQAKKMLAHPKVLGIKIHPTYHGYDILDYGDELFSFAERHKAVLLMHPQHVEQMAQLADKYPDMKLIIAHLGSTEQVDAIANARNGNIYADTSARGCALNNIVEYAVQRVGSEKILFGTDTYSCAFSYPRIALAELPMEDKENILWKNALRLFPDAFDGQ